MTSIRKAMNKPWTEPITGIGEKESDTDEHRFSQISEIRFDYKNTKNSYG